MTYENYIETDLQPNETLREYRRRIERERSKDRVRSRLTMIFTLWAAGTLATLTIENRDRNPRS